MGGMAHLVGFVFIATGRVARRRTRVANRASIAQDEHSANRHTPTAMGVPGSDAGQICSVSTLGSRGGGAGRGPKGKGGEGFSDLGGGEGASAKLDKDEHLSSGPLKTCT